MNALLRSMLQPALLAAFMLGCQPASFSKPVGYDFDARPSEPRPRPPAAKRPVPEDVVARAAGEVTAVRLADNQTLDALTLTRELLQSDAVCAGEQHGSAAQHYAELHLLTDLAEHAPNRGLELGLGLEMWARSKQPLLSAFGNGKLTEAELLSQSDYEARWGYSFAYYRPLLEKARSKGIALLALNASHELTDSVAKNGLDGLDEKEARQLPTLDLGNSEHFADFEQRMKRHPGVDRQNLVNFYAAQVVWDETMAETAANWLTRHAPMRRLLIVAGQAHCQHSAIPGRLERRGVEHVAAVWLGSERPDPAVREQFDYAVIVSGSKNSDR